MVRRSGFIAMLMAIIMMFASCSGGNTSNSSSTQESTQESTAETSSETSSEITSAGGGYEMDRETMPEYLNDKALFNIGFWAGLPEYREEYNQNGELTGNRRIWTDAEVLEQYHLMKEAGITIASTPMGSWSDSHGIRLLEAADDVGIKQLIWDEDLNSAIKSEVMTDDEAINQARRMIVEYCDYESFYGNMITDEPNLKEFNGLGLGAKRYEKLIEGLGLEKKMYFLNLFPNYAIPAQTGTATYEEYLQKYEEIIGLDYICYDCYPLLHGPNNTAYMGGSFLWNMQRCQELSSKPDIWAFLQSMGWSSNRDPQSAAEFRVQSNAALCFGLKGIKWFCYYSADLGLNVTESLGVMRNDGVPTAKYEMLKTVNNEIHALAGVYDNFEWQKAMMFIGTTNEKGTNDSFDYFKGYDNTYKRIKSVTTTKDTIVGVFKDEEGRDGFMITDHESPTLTTVNKVELEFYNCTKAVVIINGVQQIVDVEDGKLSFDLNTSDGAFVIPLYI